MGCVEESPLQEGRRYQAMIDDGLSVEEIAETIFRETVSHIKRRLALVEICDEREMPTIRA